MIAEVKSWLAGKNRASKPAARRKAKVSPTVEGMEERVLMIAPAQLPPPAFIGTNNYFPTYHAGSHEVVFWAQYVPGNLTPQSAYVAWVSGSMVEAKNPRNLVNNGQAWATTGYFRPAGSLLIGFEDLTTHTGGYVAARYRTQYPQLVKGGPWWNPYYYTVTHVKMDYVDTGSALQTNYEGPRTVEFTMYNGEKIDLNFTPDSSHRIYVSYVAPHFVPPPGV